MFLKIFIGIVVVIGAILIYASTKPDVFSVSQSEVIQASPEVIFPYVNEIRGWELWSPYNNQKDLVHNYGTIPTGPGAADDWVSPQMGKGRLAVKSSTSPSVVGLDLTMTRPFEVVNDIQITLEPEGSGTKVTWTMTGPMNLMSKTMHVFMNMDKMVKNDFAKGLSTLKQLAESKM